MGRDFDGNRHGTSGGSVSGAAGPQATLKWGVAGRGEHCHNFAMQSEQSPTSGASGPSRRAALALFGTAALGATFLPELFYPSSASATGQITQLWNPWSTKALNRSWAAHVNPNAAVGTSGGLDYNVAQATLMRAPHNGTVSVRHTGQCGNELRITHPGGWKSVFFHLHDYVVTSGTVAMGDYIAWSGGRRTPQAPGETVEQLTFESGTAPSGAHVHWHLENTTGSRQNPLDYINFTGPNGVPLAPPVRGPERYGILSEGALWVKEGSVDSGWVLLATGVANFDMSGNRVGYVGTDGRVWAKEGGIDAGWVLLEGGASSITLDGVRIAVITTNGTLIMKDGAIDSGWVTLEGTVAQVSLAGNRIGIRYFGGGVAIKEGALTAGWQYLGLTTQDLVLAGNRIGVVQTNGTALVKEGAVTAPWVTVQGAITKMQLTQDRIAVLAPGDLQVKKGTIYAGWESLRTDVVDFDLSGDKVAVVTNTGDALVWDDSYGPGWVVLQGLVSKIVVAN